MDEAGEKEKDSCFEGLCDAKACLIAAISTELGREGKTEMITPAVAEIRCKKCKGLLCKQYFMTKHRWFLEGVEIYPKNDKDKMIHDERPIITEIQCRKCKHINKI